MVTDDEFRCKNNFDQLEMSLFVCIKIKNHLLVLCKLLSNRLVKLLFLIKSKFVLFCCEFF